MRGLYLITNDDPLETLLEKLEAALVTGHVAILQYRRKKIAKMEQPAEVAALKQLCEQHRVLFVINDDLALAEQFGLGVHLGQQDGEIVDAKARLLKGAIIGRTCLNSLELAEKAIQDGASYVAFGAIYPTSTKPEASHAGLNILALASKRFSLPICAIGGLTVENSPQVVESGADLCAVISDILSLPVSDIPARVEAWATLFSH